MGVNGVAVVGLNSDGAQGDQVQAHDGQHQQEAHDPVGVRELAVFELKAAGFVVAKGRINGMITNDKFCLTRWGELSLSWWRRPLRLRDPAD